jgi:hypothetical protein
MLACAMLSHLRPARRPAFLIRWCLFLSCALCIVRDAQLSGAALVYEDRSAEVGKEGGLAASRLQLHFFQGCP